MGKSPIGWTDETWNCIRGCTEVSPGCAHCYAREQAARIVRMDAARRAANPSCKAGSYDRVVQIRNGKARWTDVVEFDAEKLAEPLRWKRARRVFVNSMSDLFHESLTNEQIAAVFGVMAACPQHTFQVLTKRPVRMRAWFEWAERHGDGQDVMRFGPSALLTCAWEACAGEVWGDADDPFDGDIPTAERFGTAWPPPNIWLGVSVEDRRHGVLTGIGWVIDGCESGLGARPAERAWFASIEEQCRAAGVAYYHKQEVVDGKLVHDFPGRQEFP